MVELKEFEYYWRIKIEGKKLKYLSGPFMKEADAGKWDGITIVLPTRQRKLASAIIKERIKEIWKTYH